jgi:antitoxin ParD1/3/4
MPNVSLGDRFDRYVEEQVESGAYASASEVIRDALRLKMRFEATQEAKLEALRRDIDAAWQQAERGELETFDIDTFLKQADSEKERPR